MTIKNCPLCGGDHWGSNKCPFIEAPCVICGEMTVMACSDCAINSGGRESVHVCAKTVCRDQHEKAVHPKDTAEIKNHYIQIEARERGVTTAYRYYGLGRWETKRDGEWRPINGIYVPGQVLKVAALYCEKTPPVPVQADAPLSEVE